MPPKRSRRSRGGDDTEETPQSSRKRKTVSSPTPSSSSTGTPSTAAKSDKLAKAREKAKKWNEKKKRESLGSVLEPTPETGPTGTPVKPVKRRRQSSAARPVAKRFLHADAEEEEEMEVDDDDQTKSSVSSNVSSRKPRKSRSSDVHEEDLKPVSSNISTRKPRKSRSSDVHEEDSKATAKQSKQDRLRLARERARAKMLGTTTKAIATTPDTKGENEEKPATEKRRLRAEAKAAEEARIRAAEEARFADETRRREAEAKAEEEARIRAAEEARFVEEEARMRAAEETRLADENRRLEAEAKAAAEARVRAAEESRLAYEKRRLDAEVKASEDARIRAAEEARLVAEAGAAEARAAVEEAKRASEEANARRLAIAEEERIAAEKAKAAAYAEATAKVAEEARVFAEANAAAEASRWASMKAAGEARLIAEARAAEARRFAAEARAQAVRDAEEVKARFKRDEEVRAARVAHHEVNSTMPVQVPVPDFRNAEPTIKHDNGFINIAAPSKASDAISSYSQAVTPKVEDNKSSVLLQECSPFIKQEVGADVDKYTDVLPTTSQRYKRLLANILSRSVKAVVVIGFVAIVLNSYGVLYDNIQSSYSSSNSSKSFGSSSESIGSEITTSYCYLKSSQSEADGDVELPMEELIGVLKDNQDVVCESKYPSLPCPQHGICRVGYLISCTPSTLFEVGVELVANDKMSSLKKCVLTDNAKSILDTTSKVLIEWTSDFICSGGVSVKGGHNVENKEEVWFPFKEVAGEATQRMFVNESHHDASHDEENHSTCGEEQECENLGINSDSEGVDQADESDIQLTMDTLPIILPFSPSILVKNEPSEEHITKSTLSLTKTFQHDHVPVPMKCYIRLWMKFLFQLTFEMVFSIVYRTLQMSFVALRGTIMSLAKAWTANPLVGTGVAAVVYAVYWIFSTRSSRSKNRAKVEEARTIAYDKLLFESREGENCYAVMHLQEDVFQSLHPGSPNKQRKIFSKAVWPKVVHEMKNDVRIQKVQNSIGGKPTECWVWLGNKGSSVSTPGK